MINFDNDIAWFDASLGGWRTVNGADDLEYAMLAGHFNAQSAKFAVGEHLHFFEFFRRQIGRVGVQGADHAVDGAIHQFFVGSGVDVVRFDDPEDLTESLDLFQRDAILILCRVNGDGKTGADTQNEPDADAQQGTGARLGGAGNGHR